MRIILTHEQTDFDALASLLGAHLLDPEALPVLPRRPNRNVRAFLNIYGADLPFVDPKDLPNEKIDLIYLVDTQSLISVKGAHKGTRVRVLDHHQRRDDLPDTWEVTTDNTGANTTLLVEAIREQGIRLTAVQAGLLLLGIYEDTGSLTYSRTTPRDIRAAAYLLEEGANLTLVNDYLNQPLSLAQQALYDTLRQQAEHLTIHDHAIILALGDATEIDEELSSIAHKLRDLLDPEALFLLLSTRGGTQMICRSTSDSIDVGQIAAHFGGGGHSRAAAALIKDRSPEEVRRELLDLLPQHVRPPLTVADIMSRAPQVLSPDTPVEKAALLMQRYGYEGYPVVENDAIVGLLTRRAVDRALAHKLNLTAASLMQAGEVHVHPDHSVEHLHRLMAETGWGQIPVVERGSHRIVGIVTRTDLIKTLNPPTKRARPHNLAARLEEALPPARLELIRQIARLAEEQNLALYIVGGFVRDLLLNYPSLDFDLVVEGDAIALAQAVGKRFGGRVTTHRRFGTAKWLLPLPGNPNTSPPSEEMQSWLQEHNPADLPATLDFITARTEFYTHPTALPTVERGSIKLDLHR
ncbi:MAG: CBS domain-containing protein, partial [Anaerolineae bacterium]